jgi:hypothetical protein
MGTTDTTKLSIEANGSEDIMFAEGQANLLSMSSSGINILSDAFVVPTGNTAQRPSDPQIREIIFNTETANIEGYVGTEWVNIQWS